LYFYFGMQRLIAIKIDIIQFFYISLLNNLLASIY
jgi:hypothetical protein